jgi:hypothetical protein
VPRQSPRRRPIFLKRSFAENGGVRSQPNP